MADIGLCHQQKHQGCTFLTLQAHSFATRVPLSVWQALAGLRKKACSTLAIDLRADMHQEQRFTTAPVAPAAAVAAAAAAVVADRVPRRPLAQPAQRPRPDLSSQWFPDGPCHALV